jgi:transketolase
MRYNPRPAAWTPAPFVLGQAEVVREGSDIGILTYGALAKEAHEAMELLTAAGHSVHFVNVRTPKPIDEAAIVRAARGTKLLVTVEDHFATGGLGTIVAEVLLKHRVMAHHLSIAFDGKWFTPTLLGPAIEAEGMSGPQIATRITAALAAVPTH